MNIRTTALARLQTYFWSILQRIKNSPLELRLARGIFWSTIGTIASRGLTLAAMVMVARILGKTAFGEFAMIQSTVGMFGVFAGFGLGLTATKYVAEHRYSDPDLTGRIIGFSGRVAIVAGGFISLALFIFAPWISERFLNAPQLSSALRIGAIILFFNAIIGAQVGVLSGFEAFKAIAYVNLSIGLISFPILLWGTWIGGLTGTVWALSFNLAINWIINHIALHRELKAHNISISKKVCIHEASILWKFTLPAVLSSSMYGPAIWVCNTLLVNTPGGYGELGIFNAADQWRMVIIFIPVMMSQVILPMLASLNGLNDRNNYFKVLKITILANIILVLVVAIPVAFTAPWIMNFYGPGFKAGSWVLVCLSLNTVLVAFNNIVGQLIISKAQLWIGLLFNFLWATALITFGYTGVRMGYGAMGLALANVFAYFLHTIWQTAYAIRLIKLEA